MDLPFIKAPVESFSRKHGASDKRHQVLRVYNAQCAKQDDSVITPVRLVVDPTMPGLNMILAKGTNKLSRIPTLLIRYRCSTHTWNTDISKPCNPLHLNDSAPPFSLFPFQESLEKTVDPDVWVMSRAWKPGWGIDRVSR